MPTCPRITCVLGTRPEVIKMAPVIARLRRVGPSLHIEVITTGQHRGLLDQALADFGVVATRDLDLMRPDQGLADLTARALVALTAEFREYRPDLVLAQGDTSTVLATALSCYYEKIAFAHVEAGLRTGRAYEPFPEEKHRVLAGHLADLHFAPTSQARQNLEREGISPSSILVTGNTVVDALREVGGRGSSHRIMPEGSRYLLVTAHRRENFGAPIDEICEAVLELVRLDPGLSVVFPVHPNPHVRDAVFGRLSGSPRIILTEPLGYREFVSLMSGAEAILTDSGGIQEEGPALGKTVFVLRDATERPEAIRSGLARLVGPHRGAILSAYREWRSARGRADVPIANPYGDGWAAERIARCLAARFQLDLGPWPAGVEAEWDDSPVPGTDQHLVPVSLSAS
ncbi:UDP-N-acetylglucosamine 2-epimerase (non-hydrolyzing) [Isosphaeraceae bacterium EP7]